MCKDKQKPCRFIVVPGEGPVLQGMLDVEKVELLSVNCNTVGSDQMNYGQRTQGKSSTNEELKGETVDSVKYNNNIDYFLAGPDKEADMEKGAKLTKSIQQEFSDVFGALGASKAHSHCI